MGITNMFFRNRIFNRIQTQTQTQTRPRIWIVPDASPNADSRVVRMPRGFKLDRPWLEIQSAAHQLGLIPDGYHMVRVSSGPGHARVRQMSHHKNLQQRPKPEAPSPIERQALALVNAPSPKPRKPRLPKLKLVETPPMELPQVQLAEPKSEAPPMPSGIDPTPIPGWGSRPADREAQRKARERAKRDRYNAARKLKRAKERANASE